MLALVPIKNILVITNEVQAPEVRKQLPKLAKDNVIAEPIARDTCAAVTLGAALVGARSTTGVMAVLPADHDIPEEKKFQQVLSDAFDLAGFIRKRLEAAGILMIDDLGLDTYADERFFSYRRSVHRKEPDYGRHVHAIALEA